ncbi:hypothetical protein V6V47_27970 [Micromonospora sp. CPCC 205539]|uniref:hypothetical protein n=1 Tax=Micromonospora sp. CPCC 205539 TaxID=3122408 RepID=UPI002FEF1D74
MSNHPALARRTLGVLATTLLACTGALAVGAPASAHHTAVQGEASCVNGSYRIQWTVRSESAPPDATRFRLVSVASRPTGSKVSAIATSPAGQFPHSVADPVVGVQTVPGSATEARLTVRAQWDNGHTEDSTHEGVVALAGTCADKGGPTGPTATFTSVCASAIDVRLTNPPKAPATQIVLASVPAGSFSQTVALGSGEKKTVRFPVEGWDGVSVTVAGTSEPLATYRWQDPGNCASARVTTRSTCDTFTVVLTDPPNGDRWTVTFPPRVREGP